MPLNPNSTNETTQWKDKSRVGVESATVIRTQENRNAEGVSHVCYVKPSTLNKTIPADVLVSLVGDAQIPTEGSRVLISYRTNERAVVIGQRYKASNTEPPYEPGERIIGHPETNSNIRLNNDGSISLQSELGVVRCKIELNADGEVLVTNDEGATIKLGKEGSVTCKQKTDYGFRVGKDGKVTIAGTEVDIYTDGRGVDGEDVPTFE